MADLQALQAFAAAHDFGLTNPLTHGQVVTLAEYWLPKIRFYEDERFHPIRLDEVFAQVERLFAELPPVSQDQWRVTKFVRTGSASGENRAFAPPVVHVPDGAVPQGNVFRPVVRVLNDGTPARDTLSLPEVGGSTMVTHGASFTRSNHFLGAVSTKAGSNTATPAIRSCRGSTSPIRPRRRRAGRASRCWPPGSTCSSCSNTSCWYRRRVTTIRRTASAARSTSPRTCCGRKRPMRHL
jgi:hypothetical protein